MSLQSGPNKPQPECPLAHKLINKLSVVVGSCDLLVESAPEDSPLLSRIILIRNTAQSMAADLAEFECDLVRRRLEGGNTFLVF